MKTKNTPWTGWTGTRIIKYILTFLAVAAGLFILSAILKVLFAYEIYDFFLGKASAIFGLDLMPARLIAILLAIATLLALPTVLSFVFLGRRKKEILVMVSVATTVCFLSMYYGTESVFFDRTNGRPIKYYVKTIQGFKFSSTGDFDPVLGAKFKPVTPEVVKEYYAWRETGKLENVPKIKQGKYFEQLTGEPIVWYSETSDGRIKLSPLPGYDTATGLPLKPMTREVAQKKITVLNYLSTLSLPPGEDEKKDELYNKIPKFVEHFEGGKIDINWYLHVKNNAFDLGSGTVQLGPTRSRQEFEFWAERILFVPPDFTIIGINLHAFVECSVYGIGQMKVLDFSGTKYEPILYLGTEGDV